MPKKGCQILQNKKEKHQYLKSDIKQVSDKSKVINDLITLVHLYNDELNILFNEHAPRRARLLATHTLDI